jgi:hypothetical protein
MRDERNTYSKMLVGKHERKRRMEDTDAEGGNNVKMCFKEMGWKVVDWIQLVQDSDK